MFQKSSIVKEHRQ